MYKKYVKRILDISLSIILLPLFFIILVPMLLMIKLDDKGPVFYYGKRLGKDGKVFEMYKFRTMIVNAPDIRTEDGSTWNSEDDPRLTRIGRILRKFSLDEIPQIINILKGDMSFIGPRPDPPDWLEKYTDEEKAMLSVLPGITGYNQVYFRNSTNGKEKTYYDLYYARNISFVLDVKIFLRTFLCVIKSKNIYTCQSASTLLHTGEKMSDLKGVVR